MSVQFDDIGAKYDPIKSVPVIRYGETFTVVKVLGELQGKDVLDLACGTGFYTRLLKKLGANNVVGVDVSVEMLEIAKRQETENPLGIEYVESDVLTLSEDIGSFDMVLAVYLLNYAATVEYLETMFQKVYDLLLPGGRFIAYTFNPDFTLDKGNATKYKFTVAYLDDDTIPQRHAVRVTVHLDTPIAIDNYQWDSAIYEKIAAQVGFREFYWNPIELDPQGIEELGEPFWNDYLENSFIRSLTCVK